MTTDLPRWSVFRFCSGADIYWSNLCCLCSWLNLCSVHAHPTTAPVPAPGRGFGCTGDPISAWVFWGKGERVMPAFGCWVATLDKGGFVTTGRGRRSRAGRAPCALSRVEDRHERAPHGASSFRGLAGQLAAPRPDRGDRGARSGASRTAPSCTTWIASPWRTSPPRGCGGKPADAGAPRS